MIYAGNGFFNGKPSGNESMQDIWRLSEKHGVLWKRARMIRAIRDFFLNRDYLEVETPCLIPAPIPEVHIDAMACGGQYLHTSPELYMKLLLAAGYPRIFQICKCFREGERGSCHLPEFTMLEWYCRDMDYRGLMSICEDLIISVAHDLGYGNVIHHRGKALSLQKPWETISVREAFTLHARMQLDEAVKKDCFDEIMVDYIEPRLGWEKPAFIYDYPVSGGILARVKKDDPAVAERFELYMGGREIANACSELTGLSEHRVRMEGVQKYRRSVNKQIYPVSERFLQNISVMPEAAGIAVGVDRLAMILTDSPLIDDVVAFTPELL